LTCSILALVSTRDSHIKPDGEVGGLIPGPIWEMPCNDLFITYFEADEMRIYVKHNCNINIFIITLHFKIQQNYITDHVRYINYNFDKNSKIFKNLRTIFLHSISADWRLNWLWAVALIFLIFLWYSRQTNLAKYWLSSAAGISSTALSSLFPCSRSDNIFRSLFGFILFHFINTMIRIVIGNL
jgi:hypothetical protein